MGYLSGGTIENCTVSGSVSVSSSNFGYAYAGGIAGRNYSGTIKNCAASVSVSASSNYGYAYAGGIAGVNSTDSDITDCEHSGKISATTTTDDGYAYAGGVAGCNYGDITDSMHSGGGVSATATAPSGAVTPTPEASRVATAMPATTTTAT